MAQAFSGRNSHRDRHGRGLRRPLLSKLLRPAKTKSQQFQTYVDSTMEYLKGIWGEELEDLLWEVRDAPTIGAESVIPRWSVDQQAKSIVIYRIPTERFGSHSRLSPLDEKMKVEEQVFEAVAELLDVDPWELIPFNRGH